ncbi:hypothetical protein Tco_1292498 [Tanacetum coccineum]
MENDDRDWMYFPRREEVSYEDDENEDMEDDLRLNSYSSQRWHGPSLDGCTFRTCLNVVPFSRMYLAPKEDGSGEDESATVDPFLAVMNKEYNDNDHERKKLELAEEHKRKKAELEDMRK